MQAAMQKTMTKIILNTIKVLVTVGGIVYIFHKIPFFDAISNWNKSALPWLAVILFLTVILMAIQANRWRGLLLDDGKKVKFRTFYAYIALGYFFNNLLPSGFGGDAVKTIAFGKRFGNTANSVAAIAISRIMGILAMILSFFIALPFVVAKYQVPLSYTITVSVFALVAILVVVGGLFSDKLKIPDKLALKVPFLLKLQKKNEVGYEKKSKLFNIHDCFLCTCCFFCICIS